MELHNGDIIVFKDNIQRFAENTYFWNLLFKTYNNTMNFKSITFGSAYSVVYSTKTSSNSGGSNTIVYNGSWDNDLYKTITIVGDQTITDEAFINWLYENTVSGLPPRVMENMYSVVGSQIEYSFSNIGDVVGTIVNNGVLSIFTLGIFIISFAVGILRRLSRRKSFKK